MVSAKIEPLSSPAAGPRNQAQRREPAPQPVFSTVEEASSHLGMLSRTIRVGAPIVVNGVRMQRQPATNGSFIVGFGPGKYNALVRPEMLRNGTFTFAIPGIP